MEHTTINQSSKQAQKQASSESAKEVLAQLNPDYEIACRQISAKEVLAQLNPDYEIACRQINPPTNSLQYIKFKDFPAEHQEEIRRGLESIAQGNSILMEEFKSEKQSS